MQWGGLGRRSHTGTSDDWRRLTGTLPALYGESGGRGVSDEDNRNGALVASARVVDCDAAAFRRARTKRKEDAVNHGALAGAVWAHDGAQAGGKRANRHRSTVRLVVLEMDGRQPHESGVRVERVLGRGGERRVKTPRERASGENTEPHLTEVLPP